MIIPNDHPMEPTAPHADTRADMAMPQTDPRAMIDPLIELLASHDVDANIVYNGDAIGCPYCASPALLRAA